MKQSGNALFLILIAVALFAALSYAVTQSGRGGGSIDRETTLIQSAELTQYVVAVRSAIQKLKVLGCSESDISLASSSWGHTDYDHTPAAPTNCQVFHPDGGGVTWLSPPDNVSNLEWEFISHTRVRELGTSNNDGTGADLLMVLPGISEEMCQTINDQLGLGFTSVPEDSGDLIDGVAADRRFDGDFTHSNSITGPTNGCPDVLCNVPSACFVEQGGNEYYIHYEAVLIR